MSSIEKGAATVILLIGYLISQIFYMLGKPDITIICYMLFMVGLALITAKSDRK